MESDYCKGLYDYSANGKDDLVKIRIKTGKGGRATFWVKQSVAGDFVGCD